MTETFVNFLKSCGYPVRLRGYLMDADITDTPIILWEETDSESCMEYSNTTGILWTWTVHIITRSPMESIKIAKKMKTDSLYKPFAFQGLGSGYPITGTDLYGRQLRFQAIERI